MLRWIFREEMGVTMATKPQSLTGKIASKTARHPWVTLATWIVILMLGIGAVVTLLGSGLTQNSESRTDFESERADELILERFNNGVEPAAEENVIVQSERYTVDDPEFQVVVQQLAADIAAVEEIESTATYYETGVEQMVSPDRHKTIIQASFAGDPDDAVENSTAFLAVIEEEQTPAEGFEVTTLGFASVNAAFDEAAENTLVKGEMIGLAIAMVVLLVVFGALVAAGLPLIMAIVAIIITMGLSAIIGQFTDLSFFIVNMITMIGLAVGIDYVLFIVARYREERETGHDKLSAIIRAGDTSSKAVTFSGLTVVTALIGLLIIPDATFFSLGLGAILVVLVSMAMTLTLLPAVLSLLGDWINKGRLPVIGYNPVTSSQQSQRKGGFWNRTTRLVMGHPIASVVLSAGLLIGLGLVALTMSLGQSGIESLPAGSESAKAYTIFKQEFLAEDLQPATVVVDAADVNSAEVQEAMQALVADIEADTAFGTPVVEAGPSGNIARIDIPLADDAQSSASVDAVKRLRNNYIPAAFAGVDAEALVTGDTAWTIDSTNLVRVYLPIVFAIVLTITFFLLLLAFRSLVIPVKAIIMNLLSVFAAYGLVTLVFQHGVGASLFGFQTVDSIDNWIPLFLFAVLFGLSMDYHIFLLSRIKERFDITRNNEKSVADGLRTTGRLITGAALIMVGVFGGFALGDLAPFQQMGFGLAAAVVLDATVVRSVLVPSAMELLGDRNWYFPHWLEWLPKINVEGKPEVTEEISVPMPEPAIAD